MKTITIKTMDRFSGEKGTTEVEGEAAGPHFAVHRSLGREGDWAVTHMASGFATCSIFDNRQDARKAAKALRKVWPEDAQAMEDPTQHPDWRTITDKSVAVIKEILG